MKSFIERVKQDINNPMNHRQYGGMTLVRDRELCQLVNNFESLDSAVRADNDGKVPFERQDRRACLVHEVQAAFNNIGVEDTLDLVMFTIAELRKNQIKDLPRDHRNVRSLVKRQPITQK